MANFSNKHPIFVQFGTGPYSYMKKGYNDVLISHCLYALDEKGEMWKFVPSKQDWYNFTDLRISYDEEQEINFN
jgi:hypothetical protein